MREGSDSTFIEGVHSAFRSRLRAARDPLPAEEVLRIDLHCHDRNSDQPSVRIGRMLGARETWLPPEELIRTQRRNAATAHTVTNHNNARSCWELQDLGYDVLAGAEFDCMMPEYGIGLHVLTFGFEPRDEAKLARRGRRSVYDFLDYTRERDIPTVLAHPLYYYTRGSRKAPLEAWEKLALLFERFEVLNGQRDSWQNLLALEWLEAMTPERLGEIARREGIPVDRYCANPYEKRLCGGSDDHMGILARLGRDSDPRTGPGASAPGFPSFRPGSRGASLRPPRALRGRERPAQDGSRVPRLLLPAGGAPRGSRTAAAPSAQGKCDGEVDRVRCRQRDLRAPPTQADVTLPPVLPRRTPRQAGRAPERHADQSQEPTAAPRAQPDRREHSGRAGRDPRSHRRLRRQPSPTPPASGGRCRPGTPRGALRRPWSDRCE